MIDFKILVVDANILFSFFKKDSLRRELIERLPEYGCKLISPDYVIAELLNEKEKIMKFSGIDEIGFLFIISLIQKKVETISKENYEKWLDDAMKISPHKKDVPYLALALASNAAVWSDERAFKKQNKVKIFSTEELKKILYE